MSHYTKQDIMRIVEEEDVQFIRLQFTDITGDLKNVAITTSQLEKALNNKCMLDGSSIIGYVSVEESDLFLYPDLDTFEIFPWRPQQGKVARLLCDVYRPDRTPFEGDPRYILKNVLSEAKELGYTIDVGPECEFFLFDLDENGEPSLNTKERGTYFDIAPLDAGENVRREIVLTLEEMGFVVEASHHEVAPAQHEVTIGYEDALKTADNILTFRMVARTVAKRHGLHATFMPKPIAGINGSGMHINLSIKKDGVNIFDNPNDKLGISNEAYYFIAGILKHISSMTAIMNPLVNSYKRLVPGYEAPVYIAWSTTNRSPLIRIPAEKGPSTRIELRSPDPSTNPYLTLAVCIAAGLDGIKNKLTPPKSINKNIFELTEEERIEEGIEKLPASLQEAIEELNKSEFIKGVLGNHTSEKFIETKTEEWNQYIKQISQWELDNYLHRI